MSDVLQHTPLRAEHVELGATMTGFGGWEMPLHYPGGIFQEHLAVRSRAGVFDISHMGRFIIEGDQALSFLQYVLTSNAAALETGRSQYTMLADDQGGAIDDAYLFRFFDDQYLLVVNAVNRHKDWDHLQAVSRQFEKLKIADRTEAIAMLSLQGPDSRELLRRILPDARLPEPRRNALSLTGSANQLWLARTGYTGEPVGFEMLMPAQTCLEIWRRLCAQGVQPSGLGARDTLRLEAGLPLYGNELGLDPQGHLIPIFASAASRSAVSFSPQKGDFIGRQALLRQFTALQELLKEPRSASAELARRIRPLQMLERGIARRSAPVFWKDRPAGVVTSGTMVPFWQFSGQGPQARLTSQMGRRAIALGYIDAAIADGEKVTVEIQGKWLSAMVMPYLLRSEAPPLTRPIMPDMMS